MESETWQERGVEMNNHQWDEMVKHLADIAEKLPGDYTQFLLVALHACIVRGDKLENLKSNAHEIAGLMTIDDY